MYKIKIQTLKKGTIDLGFTNFERIASVLGIQTGLFIGQIYAEDVKLYLNYLSNILSTRFQERERLGMFDNLNKDSVIVDIGAGTGWFDIAISKYINGGKFFMIDKQEWSYGYADAHWHDEPNFYNDWAVFENFVENSDVNRNSFNLITPDDNWPEHVDLVFSGYSYLWHYPKETYWSKISNTSASLSFDVLNKDNNMENISKELGVKCNYIDKPKMVFHWFQKSVGLDENNSIGKCCYWKRN